MRQPEKRVEVKYEFHRNGIFKDQPLIYRWHVSNVPQDIIASDCGRIVDTVQKEWIDEKLQSEIIDPIGMYPAVLYYVNDIGHVVEWTRVREDTTCYSVFDKGTKREDFGKAWIDTVTGKEYNGKVQIAGIVSGHEMSLIHRVRMLFYDLGYERGWNIKCPTYVWIADGQRKAVDEEQRKALLEGVKSLLQEHS